ncbi:MAG: hypothetical protein FWH32_01870 [Clostridiales bacterium]|nr:hypothetical protein [Clostridiales bacterium]
MTISGGEVTATGGGTGAGIGGGAGGNSDKITIEGGTVTATGGSSGNCAGIGGGSSGNGGSITIKGGTVTATMGTLTGGTPTSWGSGIGNGVNAPGSNTVIAISGGMVIATGGENAVGIGNYVPFNASPPLPSTLNMTGNAIVFANSVSAGVSATNDKGGILVRGGETQWYGGETITIDYDATIPDDRSIIIPREKTLAINEGITFANDGYIFGVAVGKVDGNAAVAPTRTIDLSAPISETSPPPYGINWDRNGDLYTLVDGADVVVTGDNQVVTGDDQEPAPPTERRIEVPTFANATITLDGASITNLDTGQSPLRLYMYTGVELVLAEGSENTLVAGDNRAGVDVAPEATLTIGGAGRLTATGGDGGAGIGGGNGGTGFDITIGGEAEVIATGGDGGAGVGSGGNNTGAYDNYITIKDEAKVIATGGFGGAGVGGGQRGSTGGAKIDYITIKDEAEVIATGGRYVAAGVGGGAGIGGGLNSDGGIIVIEGGTVTAMGGGGGAGIGGGDGSGSNNTYGNGGKITISGGTVTATGGYYSEDYGGGAGIGGGWKGDGGDITISGGTVTATAGAVNPHSHVASALAIGPGEEKTGGNVTVTGVYGYWTNADENADPGGSPTNRTFFGDKETFSVEKGYKYIKLDGDPDVIDMASFALSPTHAILTEKSVSAAVVEAVTAPMDFFDFSRVSWSVDRWSGSLGTEYSTVRTGEFDEVITVSEAVADGTWGPAAAVVTVATDGGSVKVEPAWAWVSDTDRKAHTIRVRASYDSGLYMAIATIELMPDADLPARAPGDPSTEGLHTSVRVLEPSVAVNRALERGTLVPILITQQEPADMGLTAFSDDDGNGVGALDDSGRPMPSLPEIGAIRLVTGTGANVREVAGYKVEIPPEDDRFIEVTADATAKNTKNVRLQILRAGVGSGENGAVVDADWADEAKRVPVIGQFNLTVSNRFPSVTLRVGDLNLMFPTESSTVTATSTAGAVDVLNIVDNAKTQTFINNIAMTSSVGGEPATVKLVLKADTDPTAPEPVLTKAGTQRGRATVQVAGFKPQEVAMNVKVVNAAPNVRLAKNSVALHYPGEPIGDLPTVQPDPENPTMLLRDDFTPAVVNLISGVRNGVFEDGYKVKRVEINHTDPDRFNLRIEPYNPDEPGVVKLTPLGTVPKTVPLRVIFHDPAFPDNQQNLEASDTKFRNIGNLRVTMRASTALNVTNKATPVAVNRNHVSRLAEGGSDDEYETEWIIRDIPIGLNVDNIVLGDWKAQSISETSKTRTPWLGENILDGNGEPIPPVRVEAYKSGIRLYAHKAALEDLMERGKVSPESTTYRNMTYRMLIGSDKIRDKNDRVRTFAVNLTFNAGNPTFTVSLNSRTRIDVANPKSFQTATVRLTGTTAEIAGVRLYPTAKNNDERPTESTDFIAEVTGALTFNIMTHPDNMEVVPKVRQNLSVQLTLTNGQVLNSWTALNTKNRNTDRTIGVTALQAVQRATSRTVTLYRSQPLQGAAFEAVIGTPAGSSLGYYGIDQARLDSIRFGKPVLVPDGDTTRIGYEKYGDPDNPHHGGLVLARTGETTYALSFEDGIAPGAILHRNYPTNKTTTKLNNNYAIRVELWAEGTYKLDPETGRAEIDPTTGKVVPLRNAKNKAMTTPTVYNIRVILR